MSISAGGYYMKIAMFLPMSQMCLPGRVSRRKGVQVRIMVSGRYAVGFSLGTPLLTKLHCFLLSVQAGLTSGDEFLTPILTSTIDHWEASHRIAAKYDRGVLENWKDELEKCLIIVSPFSSRLLDPSS